MEPVAARYPGRMEVWRRPVDAANVSEVVCTDILAALDLFRNPLRMTATLRS